MTREELAISAIEPLGYIPRYLVAWPKESSV